MRTKLQDIIIRPAETTADLEQLYRFRYTVYVEEMQRPQRYADHVHKRIEEPLDATAVNWIALKGDVIVGCVRWNCGLDTDFGEYVELYGMRCAGPYFPNQCSITTKLMTARPYRRSSLGIDLCIEAFAHALTQGVVCDFIDCNPHLERFFARFGYRNYCGRINHPEYGDVLPMVCLLIDHEHRAELDSPFGGAADVNAHQPDVVRWFHEHVFSAHQANEAAFRTLTPKTHTVHYAKHQA
jgi:hypothetical protein